MKEFSDNSCNNCTKIQENDQKYRSFISKFSHEVRNPLTLIYSSLQLIEKDCPQVTASDLWPQIKQDMQTTLNLLNDVSALNRQYQLRISSIPVIHFLSDISASFSSMMKSRDITFLMECSDSLSGLSINADEIKLREAITNLLVNAADAAVSAGSAARVLLFAEKEDDQLCIHIKDNGCGIPEEYRSTLFDPFVTHKPNGTGLGLNIVKTIASQHNGTITFDTDSTPSHPFTDFCLSIPL